VLPYDFTCAELRTMVAKLVRQLRARDVAPQPLDELVAHSEAMKSLLAEVNAFADCDHSVLVRGETGVGKERIAQQLHLGHQKLQQGCVRSSELRRDSRRAVRVAVLRPRQGSFTGAVHAHRGYFEQATGGTLFLDEIGDLPKYQQVKLLRVLEDGAVTRLGATSPIRVDFRLVAATNRNLREMVASGEFRADLFYRLAVIELHVPSLEERGEIDKIAIFKALLANVLGDQLEALGETPHWLSDAVAETYFPGNVRQLRNLAERVGVIARQLHSWDQHLIQRAIALTRGTPSTGAGGGMGLGANAVGTSSAFDAAGGDQRKGWNGSERNRIIAALEINDWKRQDTAQHLGISRKVLWEKMRKYQILDGEPGIPEDA
jgi:DNA-binding NtrC family response regulator